MSKTNLALRLPTVETITVEPSCEIATDLSILKEAGFKISKTAMVVDSFVYRLAGLFANTKFGMR